MRRVAFGIPAARPVRTRAAAAATCCAGVIDRPIARSSPPYDPVSSGWAVHGLRRRGVRRLLPVQGRTDERIHCGESNPAGPRQRGQASHELVDELFLAQFANDCAGSLDDSAVLHAARRRLRGRLAFTTDSYVVQPLFFPGGDIGKLAVCGTVNDLAMRARGRCT